MQIISENLRKIPSIKGNLAKNDENRFFVFHPPFFAKKRKIVKKRKRNFFISVQPIEVSRYNKRRVHRSSEIRDLCLIKLSCETLQNLPFFWNKNSTLNSLFVFHFEQLWICKSGCPWCGLCQHRPGGLTQINANFEAFCYTISSSINLIFLMSAIIKQVYQDYCRSQGHINELEINHCPFSNVKSNHFFDVIDKIIHAMNVSNNHQLTEANKKEWPSQCIVIQKINQISTSLKY